MAKKKTDDVINEMIVDVADLKPGQTINIPPNTKVNFKDTAAAPTLPPAPIPGLTAGRMVHYILGQDKHRPAIIANVIDPIAGTVNLIVFFDGPNDGRSIHSAGEWFRSVDYSEFHVFDTWHFIEKA